ncbi:MAG TPA: toprim domain-containing protein, partial [Desulfobacterales bacterium]|nr:toprim domain-containing protein [Desulfobacterales bacterium]
RVLFPIYDRRGRVIGFGGRIIGDGQPKYMNSPESLVFNKSASLLGLYQQGDEIRRRKQAILVEGNFDLVSLVVHGCLNVVAPLGTALTTQQLKLLKGFADECVLLFDGDTAGVKAAMRSVPLFLSEQMAGKVALLPTGHDPDTFVREKGLEALNSLLKQAKPLPEFVLAQLVEEHGLTFDGKRRIIGELQPLLKSATSRLQRSLMVSHFSEILGVAPEELAATGAVAKSVLPEIKTKTERFPERLASLSSPQRRMLTHMVLYPDVLPELEKAGIRICLAGTVGEVLLLQLQALQEGNGHVEPEELLNKLPPGGERVLVSDILLNSSTDSEALFCQGTEEELAEILVYLECETLRRKIAELEKKLNEQAASLGVEKQQNLAIEMVMAKKRLEEQQKKYASFLC